MARDDVAVTRHRVPPSITAAWRRARSLGGSYKVTTACALFALAMLAGAWNYSAGQDAQAEARHQRGLVVRSDHLVSAMKDLEIGERGYVLTGRDEYLQPYEDALPQIGRDLDGLDALGRRRATGTGAALPSGTACLPRRRSSSAS